MNHDDTQAEGLGGSEATKFLELLRPSGPWMLLAIVPDGDDSDIEIINARTRDEIDTFVAKHDGQRNLYYSVNPTRKPIRKKAAKVDIAVIEYLPADLDPKPDETPEAAKLRYLAKIDTMRPQPTAIIDSGNGLNLLLKMAEPILLPEPDIINTTNAKGKVIKTRVYPKAALEQIADIEGRAKRLMEQLGSVAGTQNIDRILRLPGTTNLPNKAKITCGRTPCPTQLLHFNGTIYRPEDFPKPSEAQAAQPKGERLKGTITELPPRLVDLLMVADLGAGAKHGKYESRSALLFGFLLGCLGAGIRDDVMFGACLDDKYRGKAIWAHCHEQNDPSGYLDRQIERAEKKFTERPKNTEIERLAQLSRFDYESERKAAAKALGFRPKVLDDLVEQMREDKEEVTDRIEQLNAEYALVLAGDKAAVMKFDERTRFRLLQTSAFTTWFGNEFLNGRPLGDYWLKHPERRQYAGIEFAPPGSYIRPDFYNLWQGFTCKPVKGDCSKFMAHLKDNGANGDHATFLWQFGWWAQIFQQPSVKAGTSLVYRGPFGAGKTKIGEVFGALLGEHYQPVSRAGHITGQFNSHMASLLLLHADEAFWAGDKESIGVLRDLVTGSQHLLEYKGVDKIRIKNFIRMFVTGNPEWMVPAGFKERRWAVFDIGEDKMQDHGYFRAIDEEMNNGGREALLYELLNFDLSQVNLRVIPKTAALLEQQIESMTPEQTWWHETLMRGALPTMPYGISEPNVWLCLKDDLFVAYIQHARMQGISRKSTESKLGKFLKKQLGAALTHPRPLSQDMRTQLRCFGLPSLRECREKFDKALGQPAGWPEGWESTEWVQNEDWRAMVSKLGKGSW